jgi:predicted transcriptional regulator
MSGERLDVLAMRIARATLNISQQDFADFSGLSKSIIARSEKEKVTVRRETWDVFKTKIRELGVVVDWVPSTSKLNILVMSPAVIYLSQQKLNPP